MLPLTNAIIMILAIPTQMSYDYDSIYYGSDPLPAHLEPSPIPSSDHRVRVPGSVMILSEAVVDNAVVQIPCDPGLVQPSNPTVLFSIWDQIRFVLDQINLYTDYTDRSNAT